MYYYSSCSDLAFLPARVHPSAPDNSGTVLLLHLDTGMTSVSEFENYWPARLSVVRVRMFKEVLVEQTSCQLQSPPFSLASL